MLSFCIFVISFRTILHMAGLRSNAEGERATAHGEGQSTVDGRATSGRDAGPSRRLRPHDLHLGTVPSSPRATVNAKLTTPFRVYANSPGDMFTSVLPFI